MRKKEDGFTLVEVLIASAILAIALIPLLSVLNINLRGMNSTKDMRIAANLARGELERVKSLNCKEEETESETYEKTVNNVVWKIERSADSSTDPLGIWIKIYKKGETKPAFTLFTLKENLTWR
ncbi:MAG: prepilin-type N-terminal cleavage/methylation domain-containing protein [Elusimicrobia bacterium]|nr:prepilin-type N-terminal cleavage/methylation domain-containing protein [Elusimicrobiota bacterium]